MLYQRVGRAAAVCGACGDSGGRAGGRGLEAGQPAAAACKLSNPNRGAHPPLTAQLHGSTAGKPSPPRPFAPSSLPTLQVPPMDVVAGPTPGFEEGREPYFILRGYQSEVEAALARDVATLWLKLHEEGACGAATAGCATALPTAQRAPAACRHSRRMILHIVPLLRAGCTERKLRAVKWNLPFMEVGIKRCMQAGSHGHGCPAPLGKCGLSGAAAGPNRQLPACRWGASASMNAGPARMPARLCSYGKRTAERWRRCGVWRRTSAAQRSRPSATLCVRSRLLVLGGEGGRVRFWLMHCSQRGGSMHPAATQPHAADPPAS